MTIEWTYWAYAALQSMLLFTCIASCALFSIWSWETRHNRPALWAILPLSVWTHAAIAVIAIRWIVPRATDPAFSVSVLRTVSESQSYAWYALSTAALLAAVAGKVAKVWTVRSWSGAALAALFGALLLVSVGAALFHRSQIDAFCADGAASCSTGPPSL